MANYMSLREQTKKEEELLREYKALKAIREECQYGARHCVSCGRRLGGSCKEGPFLAARGM